MNLLPSPAVRQWSYTVSAAGLAVLVYYGVVESDAVPLWLGLIAAVGMVSNGTAAAAVRQQRRDGTVK